MKNKKRLEHKSSSQWYKNWLTWILVSISIAVICLIIMVPFVINDLIKEYGQFFNMSESLKVSDFLSYLGAIFGLLGTVLFSSITLAQNYRLHQINERLLENEHRYSSIPQFEILNVTISYNNAFLPKENPVFIEENGHWEAELTTHFLDDQDCEIELKIALVNVGDGLAKNLKATYIDSTATYEMIKDLKDASIFVEEDHLRHITRVGQNATFCYSLPLLMSSNDNDVRGVTLEYTNLYDYPYLHFLYVSYVFIKPYRFRITVEMTNDEMF